VTSAYREIAPSGPLTPFIECFWTGDVLNDSTARILPDGCADVLFVSHNDRHIETQIVGMMTRPHLVPLAAGTSILGVRFRAGMIGTCLGISTGPLNDRTVAVQFAVGSTLNNIARAGAERTNIKQRIAAIEDQLIDLPGISSVQKAIGELIGRKGQLSMQDFAAAAGVSERQLRRTCLK
jgi:hypothetical protein